MGFFASFSVVVVVVAVVVVGVVECVPHHGSRSHHGGRPGDRVVMVVGATVRGTTNDGVDIIKP